MAAAPSESLTEILKATSRSFYLTLRVLPRAIRPQISLAYLLARAADTIADTELVPIEQRLETLQRLRERISGHDFTPIEPGELAKHQGCPAEKLLLERIEDSLAALRQLPANDLPLVEAVLRTITSGQELDLRRFAFASAEKIVPLETAAELDDYTYRVAGCVGEFWTRICRAHLFPDARLNDSRLIENGVRFGKGLQLVNILRDLPADLRKGRCYLPAKDLAGAGLKPADLLDASNTAKLRPVYNQHLETARAHLAAGWDYTNALPRSQLRIRLACAWPILIGARTLELLGTQNVLDPRLRIKVTRGEVRRIRVRSLLYYPFAHAWRSLISFPDPGSGKAVASAGDLP